MILYLDASALVKRYVVEKDSDKVNSWIDSADLVLTCLITRVEVAAAIARALRMGYLRPEETTSALHQFRSEWESIHRLPVTESTVRRGDFLACEHNLRGYDATHLACALLWGEALGKPVTIATFDLHLARAARDQNLSLLPSNHG